MEVAYQFITLQRNSFGMSARAWSATDRDRSPVYRDARYMGSHLELKYGFCFATNQWAEISFKQGL